MGNRTFQQRVVDLRTDHDMSQADLAGVLNITKSAVGFYETGVNKPNHEVALKICDYFNVTLDYLFGRVDYNLRETVLEKPFINDIQIGAFVEKLANMSQEERKFFCHLAETISDYRIDKLECLLTVLSDIKK